MTTFYGAVTVGVAVFRVAITATGTGEFQILGLPNASARETRIRVTSALAHEGILAMGLVTVAVEGPEGVERDAQGWSALDLPIAMAVAHAQKKFHRTWKDGAMAAGELALDGRMHPIRSAAAIMTASYPYLVLPQANEREIAAMETHLDSPLVLVAASLAHVIGLTRLKGAMPTSGDSAPASLNWSDVQGNARAKRALEIGAAGCHSVLLVGAPGTGRTMLARRASMILPPLAEGDARDMLAVGSVAGLPPLSGRPFRAPHHTVSDVALVGNHRPGEVSLAHGGVLFLDEVNEFRRTALEGVKGALEKGEIHMSPRVPGASFPARPWVIGASHPCPCGYAGDARCQCPPEVIARYRDRCKPIGFDLIVRMGDGSESREDAATVQARVTKARKRQVARGQAVSNARLDLLACMLDADDSRRDLSASEPETLRMLRVARTIADLEGADRVTLAHTKEAAGFVRGYGMRTAE